MHTVERNKVGRAEVSTTVGRAVELCERMSDARGSCQEQLRTVRDHIRQAGAEARALREIRLALRTRPTGGRVASPGPRRTDLPLERRRAEERAAAERMFMDYARTRDPFLRERLVVHYEPLAASLARNFAGRESLDDLLQVARLALLHAIDRFDPDRGRPFVVFARATINGELKRHLRDNTWRLHVPRSLQERYLELSGTSEVLAQELGRPPAAGELAERAAISQDEATEALDVGQARRLASLDGYRREGLPFDVGQDDRNLARLEDQILVRQLVAELPPQDQQIVKMRFWDQLSQAEIGQRLGVSQMAVCRRLGRILNRVRASATPC